MKKSYLFIAAMIIGVIGSADAGTLVNGNWAPAGCGVKPVAPQIDGKDVETFNKSVAAINEWQQQARVYFECLVKEANADNAAIAEAANREQAGYRESVENVGAAAEAAKKKLDAK